MLIEVTDYEREVGTGLRLWEGSNTVSWGRNWQKGKGAVQGTATQLSAKATAAMPETEKYTRENVEVLAGSWEGVTVGLAGGRVTFTDSPLYAWLCASNGSIRYHLISPPRPGEGGIMILCCR